MFKSNQNIETSFNSHKISWEKKISQLLSLTKVLMFNLSIIVRKEFTFYKKYRKLYIAYFNVLLNLIKIYTNTT